jgi:steroid 5-alpha reductase family enzyme
MTILLLKVSGVSLLEKTLVKKKKDYSAYIEETNAFIPWFPKKHKENDELH